MARGRASHSHSRSHTHTHHHSSSHSSRANYRPGIETFGEIMVDGVYSLQGPQINVIARMTQPLNIAIPTTQLQNSENQLAVPPSNQITPAIVHPDVPAQPQTMVQANISVMGIETAPLNTCCMLLTIIFASFLLFPLFFMCCMWWKKIVSAKYELAVQFYRALGTFLRRETRCTMLNLVVADNAFNAEKAQILHQSLSGSSLTGFTFKNVVLDCNYNQTQADSFIERMAIIKSLPFPTQITWGSMTL